MKADVTLAGDTLHIVVENPDRKLDGNFTLTFEPLPLDAAELIARLRILAAEVETYVMSFAAKSA